MNRIEGIKAERLHLELMLYRFAVAADDVRKANRALLPAILREIAGATGERLRELEREEARTVALAELAVAITTVYLAHAEVVRH
jgi:hypothetical protein